MIYDLKQLRCFVTVGEELHFGRAAKRLNMTQPPLSRQIQMLEYTLQVQLLSRTSRSVRLTAAGRAFLADARRILAFTESAASAAQRIAKGESGSIRLSFTAGSSYSFLPRLLALAKSELKDVGIVLSEMVTMQQMEALREKRIDFGLVRPPVDERGLSTILVARERLLLAVSTKHRPACGPLRSIKDLEAQPFITFSPVDGRYFYELIEGMFKKARITAKYVQYISQVHSILALVSVGIGISLVPETAKRLRFEGVRLRNLLDPPAYAELFLVWNPENDNPAVPLFRDLVMRRVAISPPLQSQFRQVDTCPRR